VLRNGPIPPTYALTKYNVQDNVLTLWPINNNNNKQNNVYGAVIVLKALREFTRFINLMNAPQRQVAADLWTKPTNLSHRQLGNYIHHRHYLLFIIYYYYSARNLILILQFHNCRRYKAESTWVAGYMPRWCNCPKTVTHPSINWVWRVANNALPLSHTANPNEKCIFYKIICLIQLFSAALL